MPLIKAERQNRTGIIAATFFVVMLLAACKMGPPDRNNADDPKASNYNAGRSLILSSITTQYVSNLAGANNTTTLTYKTNAMGAAYALKAGSDCANTTAITGTGLSGTTTSFITASVDASSLNMGNNYLIMCVSGKDDGGVTVSLSDTVLVVRDETAPTLVSKSPDSGQNGDVSVQPIITFSEPILPSSATSTNFTLEQRTPGISTLSASISVSGNSVTLAPVATLTTGQTFRIYLTTGIKDRAGNALGSATQWDFTASNMTVGMWDQVGHTWGNPSGTYSWGN